MFNNKIGTQIINLNMNSKFLLASVAVVTAGYTTTSYLSKSIDRDRDIQLKDRDIQIKNLEKDRDIQLKDRECQMKERIVLLKYSNTTTNNNK